MLIENIFHISDMEENSNIVEGSINLARYGNSILKLRKTIVKIRISEQLQLKLGKYCKTCNNHYIKPTLDVRTRWDSK